MSKALASSVRQELLNEHATLEAALKTLSDSAASPDARPLQEAWSALEARLLAHLDLEESTIMPLFAAAHADEARGLVSEHDRIRDAVFELGLCCDLHAVRKSAVDSLVEMLRTHAEREDATLYRWLDEHAGVDTRRHLLRLLVQTVRAELQSDDADGQAPAAPSS